MNHWHNNGPKNGLYCEIVCTNGTVLNTATKDSAESLVKILNSLEESSAFGQQCLQDQHENAYIEATIHKQIVRAASVVVEAFESGLEADAIHHLGKVLDGNVYSIISKEPRGAQSLEPMQLSEADAAVIGKPPGDAPIDEAWLRSVGLWIALSDDDIEAPLGFGRSDNGIGVVRWCDEWQVIIQDAHGEAITVLIASTRQQVIDLCRALGVEEIE